MWASVDVTSFARMRSSLAVNFDFRLVFIDGVVERGLTIDKDWGKHCQNSEAGQEVEGPKKGIWKRYPCLMLNIA